LDPPRQFDTIYFNSIDVDEGAPSIPALSAEPFAEQISQVAKLGHTTSANLSELKFRADQPQDLGMKAGADPKKLDSNAC
jgi:hypothetical protein